MEMERAIVQHEANTNCHQFHHPFIFLLMEEMSLIDNDLSHVIIFSSHGGKNHRELFKEIFVTQDDTA